MSDTVDFFKGYIHDATILTDDEIKKLIILSQQGNMNARDLIIHSNIKLVISIASQYAKTKEELEELTNEGVLGLIECIKKFDMTKGVRFSTYAVIHIKNKIINGLANYNPVHYGAHVINNLNKIKNYIKKYKIINYQSPTIEEIAEYFSMDKDDVQELLDAEYRFNNIKSLETPVNNDNPILLKDYIEDTSNNFLEDIIDDELICKLRTEILNLSNLDRTILNLRFYKRKSISETARILNSSREKITNHERKTILILKKKLKHEL